VRIAGTPTIAPTAALVIITFTFLNATSAKLPVARDKQTTKIVVATIHASAGVIVASPEKIR
jgi:hypothetical protein